MAEAETPTDSAATPVLPGVTVRAQAITPRTEEEAASGPGSSLSGAALSARTEGTLGATLQDQLGVANASFGPNVGLPVIRGQTGARTRALLGGIATHDASSLSADHGVMLEPGLAESITVWRGPSAVRFGGGTLGGAVEIEDGRIPQRLARRLEARSELRADRDGRFGLVRIGGPLGEIPQDADGGWSWRADVHARRRSDTHIPGRAIDEAAVVRQFGLPPARNSHGVLPGTQSDSHGGALGVSRVTADGLIGLAWSSFHADYGIPPGAHSHAEPVPPGVAAAAGAGDLRIRARQSRWSAQARFTLPAALLPELHVHAVHTDYTHDEVEAGRLFTTFHQRAGEVRAEVEHRLLGASAGRLGLQVQRRHFAATGLEAFAPPTDLTNAGLFSTWRFDRAPWQLDFGARVEHQETRPAENNTMLGVSRPLPVRRFTPASISAAGSHAYKAGGAQGTVTLTRWLAARAPDIPELYAGGPHHATRTFDIGNTGLDAEVLKGWDVGWDHAQGSWAAKANVFHYRSGNYIYQRSLGWFYEAEEGNPQAECARLDHCLPATKYEQAAARLHGFEGELAWTLKPQRLRVALFADAVRGRLRRGGDLPRLPPRRWGVSFETQQGAWRGEWRVTRAEAQRRAGENETPTEGYVRLDGSLRWQTRLSSGQRVSLFLIGRNLTNQTIRHSTSFLRNYAPEAGRVLEVGMEARL